jgi:integrase
MRFRLASGSDSSKVLGPAWTGRGRPPRGYLSEGEALAMASRFAEEHSTDTPAMRRTFQAALDAFLQECAVERRLRGSTVHGYRKLGERLACRSWGGGTWAQRRLDTFSADELLALRSELVEVGCSPETVNHYRRVLRGVFGREQPRVMLAWPWMAPRPESEGRLRFYIPVQVRALLEHAGSEMDRAVYTLASEAGPRLSEIRALKVANVDFEMGVLRLEDGFTTTGGHAGNKGRRARSVPMTAHVRAALEPFCEGKAGESLVFENDRKPGEPICGTWLYRHFLAASAEAGLPRIRLHDLRHTFGTQAIRAFRVHEVQRLMGHRHLTTTEIYLHYAPDHDAAKKLTALWEDLATDENHTGAR